MNGNMFSESAWQEIVDMVRWWRKSKNLIKPQMRRRQIISSGGSGGIDVRRAKVTEDAPAGNSIIANLYDSSGIVQTSGDESGVTVYCFISGGSSLNQALRRLEAGDEIVVTKLPYNTGSSVELRWYCISDGFQASEDCGCS